jgi:hypothetical protein
MQPSLASQDDQSIVREIGSLDKGGEFVIAISGDSITAIDNRPTRPLLEVRPTRERALPPVGAGVDLDAVSRRFPPRLAAPESPLRRP